MKIIRNRFLPVGRGFSAINLFGVLFVKPYVSISPRLLNHERIHTFQQRELLFVGFYLAYVAEWLVRLVIAKGNNYKAYAAISFEREAYANEKNLDYLKTRRPFAQWRRKASE